MSITSQDVYEDELEGLRVEIKQLKQEKPAPLTWQERVAQLEQQETRLLANYKEACPDVFEDNEIVFVGFGDSGFKGE